MALVFCVLAEALGLWECGQPLVDLGDTPLDILLTNLEGSGKIAATYPNIDGRSGYTGDRGHFSEGQEPFAVSDGEP